MSLTVHLFVTRDTRRALQWSERAVTEYYRLAFQAIRAEWPGARVETHDEEIAQEDYSLRSSSVCDRLGVQLVATVRLHQLLISALNRARCDALNLDAIEEANLLCEAISHPPIV